MDAKRAPFQGHPESHQSFRTPYAQRLVADISKFRK